MQLRSPTAPSFQNRRSPPSAARLDFASDAATLRSMCGICGMLAISPGFDASESTVVAMRDTMVHRGPDDAGAEVWAAGDRRVAFGHRRLSIVDLSPAGHNPMPNEDGTVWITFNGEIYNHRA